MTTEFLHNQEPASPQEELAYKRGDQVRIPRSDGGIETWTVRGVAQDGKISVHSRNLDIKILEPEIIDKYNGPMDVGSIVKVRRSNNLVDDGWEIRSFQNEEESEKETMVTIAKNLPGENGEPILHKKIVSLKSLEAIN